MSNQIEKSLMNKQLNQSIELEQNDELNLLDVVQFIRQHLSTLCIGMLVGIGVAALIATLLPKQYEATVLVKIGQVATMVASDVPIELGLHVVDRIKSRSFQDDVLKTLNIKTDDDDNTLVKQFRDSLKIKLEKSALVSLSVHANSTAQASATMQAVVNHLNLSHNQIFNPAVARLKQELASINQEMALADAETKKFSKILDMPSDKITDMKFSQTVLLNSVQLSKSQDYRSFRESKLLLEERLSAMRTYPTHILGNIEVGKKAVFPKYNIFMFAGLFLGLLLSLLGIFMRRFKMKYQSSF